MVANANDFGAAAFRRSNNFRSKLCRSAVYLYAVLTGVWLIRPKTREIIGPITHSYVFIEDDTFLNAEIIKQGYGHASLAGLRERTSPSSTGGQQEGPLDGHQERSSGTEVYWFKRETDGDLLRQEGVAE